MSDRLGFAAIILVISLAMTLQKVDWEWRWESPLGPPTQCTEIVLPPSPVRQGWLSKSVKPHTQPACIIEGAEADLYLVTGYAVGDDHTPGQVTADGRLVRPGITVACPGKLPLGTMIIIEEIGGRVCEDRGSAIDGQRLDVAFETPEQAMEFGTHWMKVLIIR